MRTGSLSSRGVVGADDDPASVRRGSQNGEDNGGEYTDNDTVSSSQLLPSSSLDRHKQPEQDAVGGGGDGRRGDRRFRSESCTDELLAASRVRCQAFFGAADQDKPRQGSGGSGDGEGAAIAKHRSGPRSQSFDLNGGLAPPERRAVADDESWKRVSCPSVWA